MDHFDPFPKPASDVLEPASHAASTDAHLSQAQAASMRRKKNADAQAAFRARRANYIASLEETVTSLEAVVLSLQDTCREARNDADDLRHENARLHALVDSMKQAARDRDKQWRDFWAAKQQTLGLDDSHLNDLPPRLAPSPPYVDFPPPSSADNTPDHRFPPALQPFTTNPEGNWIPGPFSNTRTPCVGESAHPSHSSDASDSPQSVQYSTRFPLAQDENRMSLVNLSLPGGAYESASALAVPDYASDGFQHRHSLSENERYPGRPRRAYSGPHPRAGDMYPSDAPRATSPSQMPSAVSDTNGQVSHSTDGAHLRPRRHTTGDPPPAPPHSRSSSPSPRDRDREPPMSNTLAVIKAQAFGSLRRTRTRVKKSADTGSKVAIDILCTRGIGMGVQSAPAPSHSGLQRRRKGGLDDIEMTT